MLVEHTIKYYDENANKFTSRSLEENVDDARERFTKYIANGGAVLEAGCGPGRDIDFFLSNGFDVDAFDASFEMCSIARERTGVDVKHKRFDTYDPGNKKFDGIWASASLLHVPYADLASVYQQLISYLENGGVFYASYKYGSEDKISEKSGRLFVHMNEERFKQFINDIPSVQIVDLWVSVDTREHRKEDKWLKAIIRKV